VVPIEQLPNGQALDVALIDVDWTLEAGHLLFGQPGVWTMVHIIAISRRWIAGTGAIDVPQSQGQPCPKEHPLIGLLK